MVKLRKSPLPDGVVIKKEFDYRDGRLFLLLHEDCLHKCYICESVQNPKNVEHRRPHRGDEKLKYDWNNLFISCGHCNGLKNKRKYDNGILDPVETDPEDYISLQLAFDDVKEKVIIKKINNAELVDITVELLEEVYNCSNGTANQKVSATALRNTISEEVMKLRLYIDEYKQYGEKGDYENIVKEIAREKEFAAFKRKIVRDDPVLSEKFAKELE